MQVVCFAGGTCGDLLVALIDPTGCNLNNNVVTISADREKLKKPHLFADDFSKNQYMSEMELVYQSLPSHALSYHVDQKHSIIGIVTEQFDTALWAAIRFKNSHRPQVWEEMQQACGSSTIEQYAQTIMDFSNLIRSYTSQIISLDRILQGHAINDLASWVPTIQQSHMYQNWILAQQK